MKYFKVIQFDQGFGWEDAEFHKCDSQGIVRYRDDLNTLKNNFEELKAEHPEDPVRIITRREKS